jgi:hypothetical protein
MNFEPGYLIASMLVSSVGAVLFMYGRRLRRFPHMAIGAGLVVYPYFVQELVPMLTIGAVLLVLLAAVVRMGM